MSPQLSLKDAVNNLSTNRSTSTKDSSVTELLAKLLAVLPSLATSFSAASAALGNSNRRHARVVRVLLGRRAIGWVAILRLDGRLVLLFDKDVVSGEDAFLSGTLVLAHPPILVHIFVHCDLVVFLERYIASVRCSVTVQSTSLGNHWLRVASW